MYMKWVGSLLMWSLLAVTLAKAEQSGPPLEVYQPEVVTGLIYAADSSPDSPRYNHCADIVRFQGKFFALWMGNTEKGEAKPGQSIYVSVSDDFKSWSRPTRPFTVELGTCPASDTEAGLIQWQPALVNYRDEILYCAWSLFESGRTFISSTTDGIHWTTREIPNAPTSLQGKVTGFPCGHGLVTSRGLILIPCALPPLVTPKRPRLSIKNPYQAVLRSSDGGRNWEWSEPIEGSTWTAVGDNPLRYGGDETIYHWEFSLFEQEKGEIGYLARNTSRMPNPQMDYPTILTGTSADGGRTWSKAVPVDIDSVSARPFASSGNTQNSLLLVANDWVRSVPEPSWKTRYNLSLFVSPSGHPDLLLPGPLLQPAGGRLACYPNGFIHENALFTVYTYDYNAYGYAEIRTALVKPLPDFKRPFLLPRGGRIGLVIKEKEARFDQPEATLGLVLTEVLKAQSKLGLAFTCQINPCGGREVPVLTLGGKSRAGVVIRARTDASGKRNVFEMREAGASDWKELAPFEWGKENHFTIRLDEGECSISVNGISPIRLSQKIWRKIAFGGLYSPPIWPRPSGGTAGMIIPLDSIRVLE